MKAGDAGDAAAQPATPRRNGFVRLACLSLAGWNVSEGTSEGAVSKRSQASCVATIDTGSRNAMRGAGSVVTDGADTQTVA